MSRIEKCHHHYLGIALQRQSLASFLASNHTTMNTHDAYDRTQCNSSTQHVISSWFFNDRINQVVDTSKARYNAKEIRQNHGFQSIILHASRGNISQVDKKLIEYSVEGESLSGIRQ